MGHESTTQIVGEPAVSFTYDPKRSLYEQFSKAHGTREGEGELETAIRNHEDAAESGDNSAAESGGDSSMMDDSEHDGGDESATGGEDSDAAAAVQRRRAAKRSSGSVTLGPNGQPIFPFLSLFEGSPTYKQRRKKGNKSSGLRKGSEEFGPDGEYDRGRSMGGDSSGRFSSASRERRLPHRFLHGSMMEEFGPGSAAEKARQAEEMSAAEMFLKQARGQLMPGDGVVRKPKPQPIVGEVGIFYHQDEQDAQQQMAAQRMGHGRGKSFDERQLGIQDPRPPTQAPVSAGYATTTFADPQAQAHAHAQGLTNISPYETISADGKDRNFVCPLYSCGRLFKRMEHLKRHMRTHTMERPFPCPRCNKNFSRSDNLTQHLRTHERTGHGSMLPGSSGSNDWMGQGEDGDVSGGEGSTNGDSPNGPGSIADSEDEAVAPGMLGFPQEGLGGLENMFNDVGMMNVDMNSFSGMLGGSVDMGFPNQMDATMCDVDVPGGVQELGREDEGELVRMGGDSSMIFRQQTSLQPQTADEYYSSLPSSATTSGMLFSASTGSGGDFTENAQWATRPQSSSRNVNPMRVHSHSSSSSTSSFGEDFLSASLSAPSHKQSFDHSGLYPPGVLEASNAGGNVGPMRRHRSMTPSLVRNGEPIRRPMTANSEFQGVSGGSPASVSSLSSNRGFHPYAGYSSSNSRTNSTHNSPQVVPVPLGNGEGQRPESRSSSYGGLHDQMRQMMSMDGSNNQTGGSPSLFAADSMFRTASPASFHQTESPATFSIDLPPPSMYQTASGFPHAATMPAGSQFGQQQYDGNYYGVQQPHNTL